MVQTADRMFTCMPWTTSLRTTRSLLFSKSARGTVLKASTTSILRMVPIHQAFTMFRASTAILSSAMQPSSTSPSCLAQPPSTSPVPKSGHWRWAMPWLQSPRKFWLEISAEFGTRLAESVRTVVTEVLHQPTLSHCQATSTAAISTSSFRSCLEHRLLTTELPQTLPPGLTPRSVVNEIRTDICVRMIRPVPTSVSAAVHSSTPVHTNTASCSGHKSQP